MTYLDQLPTPHREEILRLKQEKEQWLGLDKKGVLQYRQPYESVQHLRADYLDFSGDVVRIGRAGELSDKDSSRVYAVMRSFMPWRKGPFNIFGHEIDAEWRSNRKWSRVMPALPDLAGKVVADIGCSNGYYMFRMAQHKPRLVVGFEPYLQHYFTFKTLNSFANCEELRIEALGVEHIALFENCFDLVFLMGVIYHRASPLDVLADINRAMKPGGVLIVESQAIPGDLPLALFPAGRYAKVPGTFFVPTAACLENWLVRSGFVEVDFFFSHPMSSEEQRPTDWMVFESYQDFIDSEKPGLTVEGYPAPIRVYLRAKKKNSTAA